MGYMDVPKAVAEAKRLLAKKVDLNKEIDTVRSDLRNAVNRGETDESQTKWIGEQFPLRERTRLTEDQRKILADAKDKIKKAKESQAPSPASK